jgi:hypothetical protein
LERHKGLTSRDVADIFEAISTLATLIRINKPHTASFQVALARARP